MSDDWRVFRPAIWVAMLGIAVMLVLNSYVGAAIIGGAIGIGGRIETTRRRARRGLPARRARRR